MPFCIDPSETVTVSLDALDADKPEAQRVKFEIRHLTSAQSKRIANLRGRAWTAFCANDVEAADKLLNEAIRLGIVGWAGLKDADGKDVPFSPAPPGPVGVAEPTPDVLDDFSMRMKFNIVDEYPWKLFLTDKEKKASASPLPGDTAGSVKDAPAESAKTNQA